jgi:hypothetical protein
VGPVSWAGGGGLAGVSAGARLGQGAPWGSDA